MAAGLYVSNRELNELNIEQLDILAFYHFYESHDTWYQSELFFICGSGFVVLMSCCQ